MSSDVISIDQFDQHLDEATQAMREGSFREPLTKCNDRVEQGIQDNFINSRTAAGVPWAPRKVQTQRLTIPGGGTVLLNNPVLILSSRLLQGASNSESPDAVVEIHDRGLTRGVDIEYARPLDEGTENMPARPFMDVPEKYLQECDDIIADYGLEMIFNQ